MIRAFILLNLFLSAVFCVEYRPLVLGSDGKQRQFPNGSDTLRVVPSHDILANIPAASSANLGQLFFATDVKRIYRSNGTTWEVYSIGEGDLTVNGLIAQNYTQTSASSEIAHVQVINNTAALANDQASSALATQYVVQPSAASGAPVYYTGHGVSVDVPTAANNHLSGATMYGTKSIMNFSRGPTSGTAVDYLIGNEVEVILNMTQTSGSTTINNVTGFQMSPGPFQTAAGGTTFITNYKGLEILPVAFSGSGTTSITNHWNLYSHDTSGGSYFGSPVLVVGAATPQPGAITHKGSGGIQTRQNTTQDGVAIVGRAGGTTSYLSTITPTTLTANRTFTLPDIAGTPIMDSGTQNIGGNKTFTNKAVFQASSVSAASINLPHGNTPTTPVNGDIWTNTSGVFARINGSTVGPFSAGSGLSGLTANRILYATGSTTVADSSKLTFDPTNGLHSVLNGSGINNFTIGNRAGAGLTTASDSTLVGYDAGRFVTSGTSNTLIGSQAGKGIVTGAYNVDVGDRGGPNEFGDSQETVKIGSVITSSAGVSDKSLFSAVLVGSNIESLSEAAENIISIGRNNDVVSNTISIGENQTPLAGQVVIGHGGSLSSGTSEFLLKHSDDSTAATQNTLTLRTGRREVATNAAGHNLRIESGNGRGTGGSGSIIFRTASPGSNGTALNTMSDRVTISADGKTTFSASGTSAASINLPHGSAPTTPSNGDLWTTTSGLFAQINGATIGPFGTGGSGFITGTLTTGRVPFAASTTSLTDSSGFSFSTAEGLTVNRSSATGGTIIGKNAGNTTLTGTDNTLIGDGAGAATTSGTGNVIVGEGAASSLNTGSFNTIVGRDAAPSLTSGVGNIVIGEADGGVLSTGSGNVLIGGSMGAGNGGLSNKFIAAGDDIYFASSPTSSSVSEITINAPGGVGTNTTGRNLWLAGGRSTGNANGGDIFFATGASGASGSQLNSSLTSLANLSASTGNLELLKLGGGISIKEGSNAKMGTSVLVAGTVTVSNTNVTASSRILLTSQVDGGTVGFLRVSARTALASFTITSSSNTDTSTVAWFILEPSP